MEINIKEGVVTIEAIEVKNTNELEQTNFDYIDVNNVYGDIVYSKIPRECVLFDKLQKLCLIKKEDLERYTC